MLIKIYIDQNNKDKFVNCFLEKIIWTRPIIRFYFNHTHVKIVNITIGFIIIINSIYLVISLYKIIYYIIYTWRSGFE